MVTSAPTQEMGGPKGNFTRRGFLSLAGLVASGAAIGFGFASGTPLAFANEGGGGGGTEGGGGGDTSNHHLALIWFDRGGFVDAGNQQPQQGWNEDSMNYFQGLMESLMGGNITGTDGKGRPHIDKWRSAARQALDNARRRSGTGHARIVGVGWCYIPFHPNFGFGHGYTYDELLTRPGILNGTKVVYTVSEEELVNYTCVITGDADVGFTIENTVITIKVKNTKKLSKPTWAE